MMKKSTSKIKKWFKEHEEHIKIGVIYVGTGMLCFELGRFIEKERTVTAFGFGLQRCRDLGLIKFIDPRTGLEISANDFVEVANAIDSKN